MKPFIAFLASLLLFATPLRHAPEVHAAELCAPAQPTKKTAKKKTTAQKAAPAKTSRKASDVKKQQSTNARQQKETKEKIRENAVETEKRLNQLNLVEGEIGECNAKIGEISLHIDSLNRQMGTLNDSISTLDTHLKKISSSYAAALRKTQGRRQQTSELAFIFSSESFAQAYRRLRALRQFDKWRKRRASEIADVRARLDQRRNSLASLKKQSETSVSSLNKEKATLVKKQTETASLLDKLKNEGSELKYIMERQRRQAAELDDELDRIVAEEQRRAAEEEKKRIAEEKKRQQEAEQRRLEKERKEAEEQEQRRRDEQLRQEKLLAQQQAAREEKTETPPAPKAEKSAPSKQQQPAAAPQQTKTADSKQSEQQKKELRAKQEEQKRIAEQRRKREQEEKKIAERENREKAKKTKPVKHTGKNNGREMANAEAAPSVKEKVKASGETAPTLHTPTAAGQSGIASDATASGRDFASLKGKLPFPVTGKYTIVKRFGKQKHPRLQYVETVCSGIEIETASGAAARAVSDGEVSAILHPEGNNTVVVIRHGKNYLTVYSNLANATVTTGQKVKSGQTLGTVFADPNDGGRSVLHFEIRNQREKENPELWLRK